MGEKSTQKKQFILETAKKVFMEKGFKNVTMKDVVEACEISRGGLYLYFSSTEELFLEVLKMDMEETDDVFSDKIGDDATITDILLLFLKEQKREMLRKKNNLAVATYEYLFANKLPKGKNPVKKRFETAVMMLNKLLDAGVERGEFICEDTLGTARNIMYVLEGIKITASTVGISEEKVDAELVFIIKGLVGEEE
ncbi:MAG: TetR family transcriptional regulator [Lachnospiraceae bacterium]|nr:TetR family transcriptional regulator [Lachnospiraceae bacterium]